MNEKRIANAIRAERIAGGACVLLGAFEACLRAIPEWVSWGLIAVGVGILLIRVKLPEYTAVRLIALVLIVSGAGEAFTRASHPAWIPYALMAYGVVMLIYVQYRARRAKPAA